MITLGNELPLQKSLEIWLNEDAVDFFQSGDQKLLPFELEMGPDPTRPKLTFDPQ